MATKRRFNWDAPIEGRGEDWVSPLERSRIREEEEREAQRRALEANPFANVVGKAEVGPQRLDQPTPVEPERPSIMDIISTIGNPFTLPAQAVTAARTAMDRPEIQETLTEGLRSGGQRLVGQAAQIAADIESVPVRVAAGSIANLGGGFMGLGGTTDQELQGVAGEAMRRSRESAQRMESQLEELPNVIQREAVGAFARAYQSPSSSLSAVAGFLGPQGAVLGGTIAGMDMWGSEYVNARQLNKLNVDEASEYATWKTLPAAVEYIPTGGGASRALTTTDRTAMLTEGAIRLLRTAGYEGGTEGVQTAMAFGIDGVLAKYHPNARIREAAQKNLPKNAIEALKEIGRSFASGSAGAASFAGPATSFQIAAEYGKVAADIQRTNAIRAGAERVQDAAEAEQQRVFGERAAERERVQQATRQAEVERLQNLGQDAQPMFPEVFTPEVDVDQEVGALQREVETDIAYLQNERTNIRRNSTRETLASDFARIQEIDNEIAALRRGATGAPVEAPSSVVPDRDTTTREMFPELAQRDAEALAEQRAAALTRREEASKLVEKEQKKIRDSAVATRRAARTKFLETTRKATAGMEPEARIDAIEQATLEWEAANPMSAYEEQARAKVVPVTQAPAAAPVAAPVAAPQAAPVQQAQPVEATATPDDKAFLDDATARLRELMGDTSGGQTELPTTTAEQRTGDVREVVATTPRGEFRLVDQPAAPGADFSEFGSIRIVEAYDGDTKIGELLYANDGTPPTVNVEPEYQRRGVATAMLKMAQEQGGVLGEAESGIRSKGREYRTPAGQAFRSAADTSTVTFRPVSTTATQTTAAQTQLADVNIEQAQQMEREIVGRTPQEVAQWAVDNAPDAATKEIAQKVADKIAALQAAGFEITVEVSQPANAEEAATRPSTLGSVTLSFPGYVPTQRMQVAGTQFAQGGGMRYETVLHELYHVATQALVFAHNEGTLVDKKVGKMLTELESIREMVVFALRAKRRSGEQLSEFELAALTQNNSLQNTDEVLAWGVSNSDMQEMLKNITIDNTSAWQKFVNAIAKLFGIAPKTSEYNALERVLEIASAVAEADVNTTVRSLNQMGAQGLRSVTAEQSVAPSPERQEILDRAGQTAEASRSESWRKFKGALLAEWGIGQELAESLGHSKGRAGALSLEANELGNRLLKNIDNAVHTKHRKEGRRGSPAEMHKSITEVREDIQKDIEAVDALPTKGERDRALNALDRKYPGVGATVREIRDMKLRMAAEIIQQHYDLGRPLSQKEKATINSIIKNAERYTTRAYLATYNKKAGRKYAEGIMAAYNEDPTSENGRLVADGLEWLMTEGLVIPDAATMSEMTTSKVERLYMNWIGKPGNKKKETLIKELAALPPKTTQEMYDKAMQSARDMLGLNDSKTTRAKRYMFGESSKQNRTILEARTDIPLPLRRMMGEITDPFLREMISLQRQINLATKSKFLLEAKKIGEKNGWVSTTATEQNNVQLNDPAYGALDGLWVSGEVLDAISGPMTTFASSDADLSDSVKSPSMLAELLANYSFKPTEKLSRIQKTTSIVLDVAQMGMNFVGAFSNAALNGITNPVHVAKGMQTAGYAVLEQISPKLLGKDATMALAEVTEAQAIDSATTGEFRGQAGDIIKREIEKLSREGQSNPRIVASGIYRGLRLAGHTALQAARATYAFMDVWVKTSTYFANKDFYTEFNKVEGKGWTEEQIKRRAGWEAAGTNISYDRASPVVRAVERSLPIAMFATYFSEVFRTVGQSYVQVVRDFQLAKEATTPQGKQMAALKGLKRLAGTTAATAGIIGYTVSKLADEDDEEEKQRDLVDAPWDREKIRVEIGKNDKGKPIYFYLNKADPNGPLNDILISVLNKVVKKEYEDIPNTVAKSVIGLFVPAKGTIDAFRLLWDATIHSAASITGKEELRDLDMKAKKSGVLIDNYPEFYAKVTDTLSAGDVGQNLVQLFETLFTIGTVKPWVDARGNIVYTPQGKEMPASDPRKVWAEAGLSVAVGDPEKALKFKMMDYGKAVKALRSDQKKLIERAPRMSVEDLAEEMASIIEKEREAFTALRRHYEGYVSLPDRNAGTAFDSVDERDEKTLAAVQYGIFEPTTMSEEVLDRWYDEQLKKPNVDEAQVEETYSLLDRALISAYNRKKE